MRAERATGDRNIDRQMGKPSSAMIISVMPSPGLACGVRVRLAGTRHLGSV